MNSQPRCVRYFVLAAGLSFACTEPDHPATHLAFIDQPATVARAQPIAPVRVEALDDRGQRVTDWQGHITIRATDAGLSVLGITAVLAVEGVATFSSLRVDVVASSVQLRASGAGLVNAVSALFDVTHGPAVKLAFHQVPGSLKAGSTFIPAIHVHIEDAGGFTATSASDAVTLSLEANPEGATLSGGLTQTAVNGIATFASVNIDKPGQGYTLRATATDLSPAVSASFNVRGAFSAVTAGYFHSCALSNGLAYCWGDVGLSPTQVATTHTFTSISSGRDHRCALTSPGSAYCWTGESTPALVPGGITFSSVAAGYTHSCAITSAGAGYCWGENSSGEVGNGSFGGSTENPQVVAGGHAFAQISAGRLFSCGITTANAAYCWGSNESGNLGTGVQESSAIPAPVSGGLSFASISAGGFHACALTSAGAAYCWGSNGSGQLGDGSEANQNAPVAVSGGLSFATLSAGNRHTCAVTAAGVAYCWGDNADGMLGHGAGSNTSTPAAVSGGLNFARVQAGRFHTCGVATDGETYCWGRGGLLANGTDANSSTPTRVP